jgi:signal transduction histidine kinase
MAVATTLVACMLAILAVLQYRWVGQLSEDERVRMRRNFGARAEAVAHDFDRELTRVFFWLQVGHELRRDVPPEPNAERYDRWYTTAPNPELVRQIYQLDIGEQGASVLSLFERAPARLTPAAWPAALMPIHDRLRTLVRESREGPPPRLPFVWPDIPALLIPRPRVVERGPMRLAAFGPGPGSGYTIAWLDRDYMARALLPSLIDRQFAQRQDAAAHIGVVDAQGRLLVTPESSPPAALLSNPDIKRDLFEIRFGDFTRLVVERRAPEPTGVDSKRVAEGGGAVAGRGGGPQTRLSTHVTIVDRDERPRGGRFGLQPASDVPRWHIHVLHRAGSLEAAVERIRWRNLLVSFGVLLLLACSTSMLLVSTSRARRLAAQQMEFVAGVSHELRTPLAVIRAAAENLADGIVANEAQVRKYGTVIVGEGRRLTEMVEQIMQFAGLHGSRPNLDARPSEVGTIIDDAVHAAEPAVKDHGGAVERSVAPGLPRVMADPAALSRSIQNLIINALKYGGSPPRVTIDASLSTDAREVRVAVSDNGAGIASRDLPHIFEPFYRGATAVARQAHGSGIGLSLVKRLMEDLGGRVSVRTEPARGSAFTLHLPVAPDAPDAQPATSQPVVRDPQSAT